MFDPCICGTFDWCSCKKVDLVHIRKHFLGGEFELYAEKSISKSLFLTHLQKQSMKFMNQGSVSKDEINLIQIKHKFYVQLTNICFKSCTGC